MASHAPFRSPFGLLKRLKISPPTSVRLQRACITTNIGTSNPPSWTQDKSIAMQMMKDEYGDDFEARIAETVEQAAGVTLPYPSQPDPQLREKLDALRLPRAVQALYLRPLRRTPQYGVPSCDLQLRSYSVRNVEFFADFALRAAYYLHLPAKGPVPLPRLIERWTVPRSNFVHKKSQENFERITLRRLIQIQDGHPETVQLWLAFLQKHAYYGVGMKANVWEYEGIDVGKQMDERFESVKPALNERWTRFGRRQNLATEAKVVDMINSDVFKGAGGKGAPLGSA
ncbi:37S ribosomal protein S10, mitochondrial [Cryomyces minteri]|uniref:Small ribosomal subunit protein uS10m n=1 Tax=Cryomyces minteri TaxID=331657 RepID=A0A4V5NG97_9PEZI|nr:37S ribosomal protein S10, mitochondrial [Cryomyces minteri]